MSESVPGSSRGEAGVGSSLFGESAALSELAGLLLAAESFEELLQGVAELSVRVIGAVSTCGITLAQDGRVITVASADALARTLDEQQYEREDGPCLQALRTGEVVEAPDLASEDRWQDYPVIAVGHGIRSVLSTPLIVDGKPVGVLNLYASAAYSYGPAERRSAELLAGQAAIATTAALRHYDEVSLSEHLRAALSSRSVIDQAVGIVMAQRRCTTAEAFAMLRTISQRRNTKLRVVAADLVEATSRPDPRSPGQPPQPA
jgi:GAF domain-containing protein